MRQVRIVDTEVITLPTPPVDQEKLMRALEDVARDEADYEPGVSLKEQFAGRPLRAGPPPRTA